MNPFSPCRLVPALAIALGFLVMLFAQPLPAQELKEVNPPARPEDSQVTSLIGGRLIDGQDGKPLDDAVVLIQGNRILAAGSKSEVEIPSGAVVRDVTGRSIIPGLIDAHLHTINDLETLTLFLSHGVTTFRDPGHPFRFYQAMMQTERTMPRAFLTGAHLDSYPPIWPQQAVIIKDESHARQTVAEHVARGATAIKIYFRLPLKYYSAVCEVAAEHRIPVTAHLELVDADEAIRAGLKGIEHVTSFGTALASPELARDFKETVAAQPSARGEFRYRLWAQVDLESEKTRRLIQLIIDHDVYVCPTLAVFERRPGDRGSNPTEAEGFAKMLQFVGMCHEAGVKLVVGSHTSGPHAEWGWAYQRELELLVEAGLSPREALRAGTLFNAEFFGAETRLGTIESGKLADLVVVRGEPTEEIRAMYDVEHVMLNGNWVGEPPAESR